MTMSRYRYLALAGLMACVTQGCVRTPAGLEANWAMVVHRMGMEPIIPPQEDVKVGDLFVFDVNPEQQPTMFAATDRVLTGTRWASVNVLAELDQEYR